MLRAVTPDGPPDPTDPTAGSPTTAGSDSTAAHGKDEADLAAAAAELDAVEAALVRLEDGSFDTCELCGAPIGADRLLGGPLLTRCPAHSQTPG
jgi:RNA polymerase-binding transcription factor DksA